MTLSAIKISISSKINKRIFECLKILYPIRFVSFENLEAWGKVPLSHRLKRQKCSKQNEKKFSAKRNGWKLSQFITNGSFYKIVIEILGARCSKRTLLLVYSYIFWFTCLSVSIITFQFISEFSGNSTMFGLGFTNGNLPNTLLSSLRMFLFEYLNYLCNVYDLEMLLHNSKRRRIILFYFYAI
jgi:hypothetical protein